MSTKAYYTHEEIGKGKPGIFKNKDPLLKQHSMEITL